MELHSEYKFGILRTIFVPNGRRYRGGMVYQISIYSIAELPNVSLIVLDIVEDENVESRSCIVYQKNKYTYMTKLGELDKILNHILSNGTKVQYPKYRKDSLLAVCLDLMFSGYVSRTV